LGARLVAGRWEVRVGLYVGWFINQLILQLNQLILQLIVVAVVVENQLILQLIVVAVVVDAAHAPQCS